MILHGFSDPSIKPGQVVELEQRSFLPNIPLMTHGYAGPMYESQREFLDSIVEELRKSGRDVSVSYNGSRNCYLQYSTGLRCRFYAPTIREKQTGLSGKLKNMTFGLLEANTSTPRGHMKLRDIGGILYQVGDFESQISDPAVREIVVQAHKRHPARVSESAWDYALSA